MWEAKRRVCVIHDHGYLAEFPAPPHPKAFAFLIVICSLLNNVHHASDLLQLINSVLLY